MAKKTKPNYLQMDMFIGYAGDLAVRDEQSSMERCMFSISKNKRLKPILHKWKDRNGLQHQIVISGDNELGIATIWDKDFLLYIISQIMEAKKRGERPTPRLFVMPGEFLRWMGKENPSGREFERFEEMIRRLRKTEVLRESQVQLKDGLIKKNIESWSWIVRYECISSENQRHRGVEIWIDPIFFKMIIGSNVLHIDQDYFSITSGLVRWLYEYFRKSAGVRGEGVWRITLKDLYGKSGSLNKFSEFKRHIRRIVEEQKVIGYFLSISDGPKPQNPYLMAQRRNCLPNDDPNFEYRELGNNNRYKENKKVWDEMNRQDAEQLASDLGLKTIN